MKTDFPNPDDILHFILTIDPDEGMYKGGKFTFDFNINQNFPHEPPKVQCREKIYHPNIDLEGKVCLNILREDWKPVLNLNAVIVGLQVSLTITAMPCCATSSNLALESTTADKSPCSPTVSLPRTERFGSAEQGGCRGFAQQPRHLQKKRAQRNEWRLGEGHFVRPRQLEAIGLEVPPSCVLT
jgi:ubiquitin-protein ligase